MHFPGVTLGVTLLPSVTVLRMEWWSGGVVEKWNGGNIGTMERWNGGMIE